MSTTTHAPAPPAPAVSKLPDQEQLLLMLLTDWLMGDRHHNPQLRTLLLKALDAHGDDVLAVDCKRRLETEAEAKTRAEAAKAKAATHAKAA